MSVAVGVVWLALPMLALGQGAAPKPAGPPLPRTADGKPDLSGIWRASPGGSYSMEDTELQDLGRGVLTPELAERMRTGRGNSRVVDPLDGKIPYQPWAKAKQKLVFDNHLRSGLPGFKKEYIDPATRVDPLGVPRGNILSQHRIVQTPTYVAMLLEADHNTRLIPITDRPHLGRNIILWMGDSRGRWDGDTFVIDTTNQHDGTWFDVVGDFHSTGMHLIERLTPIDVNTLNYETLVDDPSVFTRPWTLRVTLKRNTEKDYEIWEQMYFEGEQSYQTILNGVDKDAAPDPR